MTSQKAGPVLVVDDDIFIRETIRVCLNKRGYNVALATNGQEALDVLRAMDPKPSMIYLDLQMPVLSGHEFLEALNEDADLRALDVPVVVITAAADRPRNAIAGFIRKPFELEQLYEMTARFAKI
jgi:CheY-like chemotaxis protein